jgi:hypothetical protein
LPKIPEDLEDYIVEEDFEAVRNTVAPGNENEIVVLLSERILPLKFRAPAESSGLTLKKLFSKNRPEVLEWAPNFLEYRLGKTTITKRAGGLISGPFSGCWFITFKWGLVRYAAHVGTGEEGTEATNDAKTAFLDWTCTNGVKLFRCFNPWDSYNENEKDRFCGTRPFLLGYITDTGACYSVFLRSINQPIKATGIKGELPQIVETPKRRYEVVDVRVCKETKWSGVRQNFIASMHKGNTLGLSEERKEKIKQFHMENLL